MTSIGWDHEVDTARPTRPPVKHELGYMVLRAGTYRRTIEITEEILVDLDEAGHVLGIESLTDSPVNLLTVVQVLKAVPFPPAVTIH